MLEKYLDEFVKHLNFLTLSSCHLATWSNQKLQAGDNRQVSNRTSSKTQPTIAKVLISVDHLASEQTWGERIAAPSSECRTGRHQSFTYYFKTICLGAYKACLLVKHCHEMAKQSPNSAILSAIESSGSNRQNTLNILIFTIWFSDLNYFRSRNTDPHEQNNQSYK